MNLYLHKAFNLKLITHGYYKWWNRVYRQGGKLGCLQKKLKDRCSSKGGASKEKINSDPSMKSTKDNSTGFSNAAKIGFNLRKGIDFHNCAPNGMHSEL